MSSIKLLGETSGEVVLKAPAVAGASEVILPTGTVDLANYMTATYTGDLDITGNGTFSGDLTVNTDTLYVDSTNNRVGIGQASPLKQFEVNNSGDCEILIKAGTNSTSQLLFGDANDLDIGKVAYVHGDNSMRFHTNDAERFRMEPDGDFHADGDIVAYSTTVSDVALKSDIQMIPNALDKIDEIKGYTFTRHNGQKSAGIIAQELEKVLPEAVKEKKLALVDGKTYKTVEYDAIHGLLINCIKELKEQIKELKDGFTK